jgi:WASH complex subunit strumpellin
MLYVCLFFSTNILHSQTAIMREIVDKYFPDNWVISVYMGFIVNLAETWEPFKAAKLALNNTLESVNIKGYANGYGGSVMALLKASNLKLKEGNLTKDNLLKDVNNIINLLRDCNFTIRWLMLHTIIKPGKSDKNKKLKQLRELVLSESKLEQVQLFKLLLNTAQLELITRDIYKSLLTEKENQWKDLKEESFKSLVELSEVFSGTKPLTRIQKNENLQQWFLEISKQVETLNQDDGASSRKIVQLIQALEEVQEFHQLESNMQVIQFLSETRKCMHQMIRNMNIKEDVLITLQIIGDLSYAWELIDSFTPIMQLGIKREPTLVIKLRAIFLKLSSALEVPLLRINQAHSEDFISVSQYYSSELEIYVRKVLQIIPKMMFEKMARIIEIQTSILKELPTRLDKDKLKDYAQLNERFEFAELTHSISVFSQGEIDVFANFSHVRFSHI